MFYGKVYFMFYYSFVGWPHLAKKNLTDEHKRFRNSVSKQLLGKFIFYLDTSRGGGSDYL